MLLDMGRPPYFSSLSSRPARVRQRLMVLLSARARIGKPGLAALRPGGSVGKQPGLGLLELVDVVFMLIQDYTCGLHVCRFFSADARSTVRRKSWVYY